VADREKRKKSIRKSLKKRRAELKEQGWCVDCGFLRPEKPHVLCSDCLESRRGREKARALRKKAEAAVALISGTRGEFVDDSRAGEAKVG
jgi:hypothetical protein